MYKEDDILLGRKAKDETEDFINEHIENPEQGWPTLRFNTRESFEDYIDRKSESTIITDLLNTL